MLDLKFVLANLDRVEQGIADKHAGHDLADVRKLPPLEEQRKKVIVEAEKLKAEKNKLSKDIGAKMGRSKSLASLPEQLEAINADIADLQKQSKALNDRIQELENEQALIEAKRDEILAWVPNLAHPSVP